MSSSSASTSATRDTGVLSEHQGVRSNEKSEVDLHDLGNPAPEPAAVELGRPEPVRAVSTPSMPKAPR